MSAFSNRAIGASLAITCVVHATSLVRAADQSARFYDWSGFYFGGHAGFAHGRVTSTVTNAAPSSLTNSLGGLYAGLQGGYNFVLPSRLLLGIEGDISFANFYVDDQITSRTTAGSVVTEQIDYIARLRGRIGYAFDRWIVYGTGGFAYSQARLSEQPGAVHDTDEVITKRAGWSAGGGAELAIAPEWSVRLEYLHDQLGGISAMFPSGTHYQSSFHLNTMRLGLNRKLGPQNANASADTAIEPWPIGASDWNVHGQMTLIGQGYPSFHSPYQGQNSLTGRAQFSNTTSATAFLGLRLADNTEFYVNPELMQGSGLSQTFGLGGYSNGEAQKSGFPMPRVNIPRVFLRHTIGLGGEQEAIEDGPNQLAGKQDVSRITLVAGEMSVIDFFDGNTYSHDPRRDFLNWNLYCCGSYDLTMDKVGYTWGAYAELNQKYWAFRAG
jgi:high affinity Mn2+ porin